MSTQRKRYSAEFKARVALEAIKGHKTVNELASQYGVHPTQITHWKHQLQQEVPQIFSASRAKRAHDQDALQAQLYQQIGQLKVELDWLKKTTVVKLTREAPKVVPMQTDTPLNHDERASTSSA
jgi:transposase-like protein